MSARALLAECLDLGVTVVADGSKLRFRPASAVSSDLRRRLADQKHGVLLLLRDPDVLVSADGLQPFELVERRLAALLEGRLWHDSGGWWPKEARLSAEKCREVVSAAMESSPKSDFDAPTMTRARGNSAVRAWRLVASCIVAELGWRAERAGRAAALVVDPCYRIALTGEQECDS